jgi:hypothetical protein
VVDGPAEPLLPALGIVAGAAGRRAVPYYTGSWFPEWWVRQMLRISLRLVHGQTGPRRVSKHTPAEVVAQGGDTERPWILADNLIDQFIAIVVLVSMTIVSRSVVPGCSSSATMVLPGLAADAVRAAAGTRGARHGRGAGGVRDRAGVGAVGRAHGEAAGATGPVLAHLAKLDTVRSDRSGRRSRSTCWARSTPSLARGLLPIGAWALYLPASLSAGADAGRGVDARRGALVRLDHGVARLAAALGPGVDPAHGRDDRRRRLLGGGARRRHLRRHRARARRAPRHPVAPPRPDGFSAVHEDGTSAYATSTWTVFAGRSRAVVGPVGAGKVVAAASARRHRHTPARCAGTANRSPNRSCSCGPTRSATSPQLPRVLSGTVTGQHRLGTRSTRPARCRRRSSDHDLAAAGRRGSGW